MTPVEPKQQEEQRQAAPPAPSYNDYVSVDVGTEPVGLAFNMQSTATELDATKQEQLHQPKQ